MGDELGMRIVLQDEGSAVGPVHPAAAQPSGAVQFPNPAAADKIDPLGDQFKALHEQAKAAAAQLQELKAAAAQAAEAMPEAAPASANQPRDPIDQARLEDAARNASVTATRSIIAALSSSPIFGQTISVLQSVARPLVDAAEALSAMQAAQGGASAAPSPAPIPSIPTEDGGGGVPPVAIPAGTLASAAPLLAVAAAAAAVTVGLYAAAKGASAVDKRFQELAEKLAPLNAELAAAQARAGVAGLRQDIRSARTIGPELADFTASRTSIDRSLQRIQDQLAKFTLDKINPILERIATLMEKISENGPAIEAAIDVAFRTAFPLLSAALDAQKAINGTLNKNAADERGRQGDLFTLFEDIPDLAFGENVLTLPFGQHSVSFDAIGGAQLP